MKIHIRQAGPEDLEVLVRHRRLMFLEMGAADAPAFELLDEVSRNYFAAALGSGQYKGWMAEDETGAVVGGGGLAIADWPGFPGETRAKRAWILNLYTEPRARRQGVAKRLVQTMTAWCQRSGLGSVSLHASAAGRPMYERMGFQPTNEMRLKL
jgi:GNAT superfamily N-acetyltransferase